MKKISTLIISLSMLWIGALNAIDSNEVPLETAVLRLSEAGEANWKAITGIITPQEGLVESIPTNQTILDWLQLISVQYFDLSGFDFSGKDKNIATSLEGFVDFLLTEMLSTYPDETATWNIIEKNKDDIIYEWILHKPYKNIPPQHEISRAFLTKTGFHRVGLTRKNREMSSEEKERWIKLLKENCSVVSFNEGLNLPGLSLSRILQKENES